MDAAGQLALRYRPLRSDQATANGEVPYPDNPNGSVGDIAGICNERGNVLGMMPHPERVVEQLLGSADGLGVFESLVETIAGSVPALK